MARILIIDDDPRLRQFVRVALQNDGHLVNEADDGVVGLRAFRNHPADLVLCDTFMPNKDGLETMRELLALSPTVAVIAMCGGSYRGLIDPLPMALLLGARAVLRKPFSIDELRLAIFGALDANIRLEGSRIEAGSI
jgi:DNA-binding response OmpR family regulator